MCVECMPCFIVLKALYEFLNLAHINNGPEVKSIQPDGVTICFLQNKDLIQYEASRYYAYAIQVQQYKTYHVLLFC